MALQPLFGRVYSYFERKATYLTCLIIFEGGSVLCAAAPNSTALILGRALAGVGAAGILMGSITIFGQTIPLRQRSLGLSLIEGITSVAGMLGSTLGGVITDSSLTWRFCFWINLRKSKLSLNKNWHRRSITHTLGCMKHWGLSQLSS